MHLLLAAEFPMSSHKVIGVLTRHKVEHVVLIPTAANCEAFTPGYDDYIKPFEDAGMRVEQLDIEGREQSDIRRRIAPAHALLVSGGNTYYLLEQMQKCNFKAMLADGALEGKIYIGSSAGAVIASPDIDFIRPMDDPGKAALKSHEGLGLIDFAFVPHLDHPEMSFAAQTILSEQKDRGNKVMAFTDDQLFYQDQNIIRIL